MRKLPTDSVELSFFVPRTLVKKVRTFMAQEGAVEQYYTIDDVFPYTKEERPQVYLRGIRYREDLTQKELSGLTGISVRHISEMERGKRPVNEEIAEKFAKVLNCDALSLLSL